MRRIEAIAVLLTLAAATPALAQGRRSTGVPPGQLPPAGMCRVWIDGVPPGRQPAPTDCAIAEHYVPRNGRVIYGDNTTRTDPRIYRTNGGIYPTNGRTYPTNGRTYPTNGRTYPTNGQQCVQRVDRDGVLRTFCDRDNDGDRDDVLGRRSSRDMRQQIDAREHKHGKAKKHDRDDRDDGDDDGDRDHDRGRSDRNRDRNRDRGRD